MKASRKGMARTRFQLIADDMAEGPGDLVEEPGVGEKPLTPGASDCAAVVSGVQEAMEGCLGVFDQFKAIEESRHQLGCAGDTQARRCPRTPPLSAPRPRRCWCQLVPSDNSR
jgi:hypothetical protein